MIQSHTEVRDLCKSVWFPCTTLQCMRLMTMWP
jgi:hypothetical protein